MQLEREEAERRFTALMQSMRSSSPTRQSHPRGHGLQTPSLRLPELRPGEDIDTFLDHFNVVVDTYQLPDDQKFLHLSGNLTGKAREAFSESSSQSEL